LQPFYDALAKVWDFIKKYLAPLLGGTFKTALEGVGTLVSGLVTGFSKLVGFISNTVTKIKEFVNFIKDNPVTRFFFGDSSGSKSLKAGGSFEPDTSSSGFIPGFEEGIDQGTTLANVVTSKGLGTRDISGLSAQQQAAVLRSIALQEETDRLRKAREATAAARAAATGGLSTSERIVINVNAASVIDEEGFSRAVTDALNNSTFRGTNGANNLVNAG
jgi:hypothetical protein